MRAIFYDTETTGLPLWKLPSGDPGQPHLVQIAAAVLDLETQELRATMDLTIRPDGWVIPDEVAAIHGITTEIAEAEGVPERAAFEAFMSLWLMADFRVAHNQQFDARIIRIASKRYADEFLQGAWKAGRAECTARLSTPVIGLPPSDKMRAKGMSWPKTPTLAEAYLWATGQELGGAHTAMADVMGCVAVYNALFPTKEMENGPSDGSDEPERLDEGAG